MGTLLQPLMTSALCGVTAHSQPILKRLHPVASSSALPLLLFILFPLPNFHLLLSLGLSRVLLSVYVLFFSQKRPYAVFRRLCVIHFPLSSGLALHGSSYN